MIVIFNHCFIIFMWLSELIKKNTKSIAFNVQKLKELIGLNVRAEIEE